MGIKDWSRIKAAHMSAQKIAHAKAAAEADVPLPKEIGAALLVFSSKVGVRFARHPEEVPVVVAALTAYAAGLAISMGVDVESIFDKIRKHIANHRASQKEH
jgi:hypothetical protein